MKPANKRIFISFLLLLAATTEAPAQAAGSISGTVRDPHGNVIAGASAEIFARGGGMHRITTTNPEGLYHFDHLPEGVWQISYEMRAESPGAFHALPVLGHAMYVPEIRTNGAEVRIKVVE